MAWFGICLTGVVMQMSSASSTLCAVVQGTLLAALANVSVTVNNVVVKYMAPHSVATLTCTRLAVFTADLGDGVSLVVRGPTKHDECARSIAALLPRESACKHTSKRLCHEMYNHDKQVCSVGSA